MLQCLWDCAENLQVAVRFQLVFVCCGMFPLGVTPQSYVPGLTSAEVRINQSEPINTSKVYMVDDWCFTATFLHMVG